MRHLQQSSFDDASSLEKTLYPIYCAVFLLGLWASLWDAQRTAKLLPLVPLPAVRWSTEAPSLLQLVSRLSSYQAWLLGRLAEQLQAGAISESDAVQQAACILLGEGPPTARSHATPGSPQSGASPPLALLDPLLPDACPAAGPTAAERLPQLTPQTILDLGQLLRSRQGGALSRLAGVMSLANIIWVIGAVGVTIAFFPAAYPLVAELIKIVGPALLAVHRALIPFYGLFGYALCLYIIMFAALCSPHTAPYFAFTGASLSVAVYVILAVRLSEPYPTEAAQNLFIVSVNTFMLAVFTPLTLLHKSVLLGFASSAAFFALLGFVVIPLGLGLAIGWLDNYHMVQTGGAAAILTVLLLAFRACRRLAAAHPWLKSVESVVQPFYPGLACFGSICLFLCGLIMSSRWYAYAQSYYIRNNIINLCIMLSATAVGSYLDDGTFRSSGATFLVLWGIEKVGEIDGMSMWLFMLLASGALAGAGAFLKAHPHWVMSMLGGPERSIEAAVSSGL